ncbi:MAG: hypothetical protein HPY89_09895 [Pelotomaculum sp.]|nr:hypothetical protein [Pelotomaculum sp.]
MAEEIKPGGAQDDPVSRILALQARYGMDQETMLIYISSVNLMSILNLIGRRYGGDVNLSVNAPAAAPALPPLTAGSAAGSGPALENLAGMLMKMLGSQGGGLPGTQGINPALLMNLLGALGGQNMDLGKLAGMLAGLMGAGVKPAPKPEQDGALPASSGGAADLGQEAGGGGVNNLKACADEKAVRRETPKIMKWDQLDDRKKA